MSPEQEAARREALQEKSKADMAVNLLAICMVLWAGQVFINGGYTDQPEHHAMWRLVALLPAFWGLVLIVIYRYSWTNLAAAIALSVCGFYLAKAPTVGQGASVSTSRPAAVKRERRQFEDTSRWNGLQLARYCWDIAEREGREWDSMNPPCTDDEVLEEAERYPTRHKAYATERR